jgi:hypothetical protein
MSEQVTVATVGAPASRVVIDAPAATEKPPVDATGAGTATPAVGNSPADDAGAPGQDSQDQNLGRAFARLAKKDQALRNRETQVASEAAQVKAVRDAITLARDKKDPTALLELGGITPTELTDILINLGKEPSEADRLAKLEAARAEDAKKAEDAHKADEQRKLDAAILSYKGQLTDAAKAGGDKYELTLAEGDDGVDLAFHIVDENYKVHGKVLPLEEALAMAESHYDAKAKRYLSTKKYGANKPAASGDGNSARADTAPDTLTNNHVSGAPPAIRRTALSREESLSEAARLMESRGWGKR